MIASLLLSMLLAAPVAAPRPILVEVDAREAPRRLFSAKLHIPAAPGLADARVPGVDPGRARADGSDRRSLGPAASARAARRSPGAAIP